MSEVKSHRFAVTQITGTGMDIVRTNLASYPLLSLARAYAEEKAHALRETLYIHRYGRTRYQLVERVACRCYDCIHS